jgi:hypothetical protein
MLIGGVVIIQERSRGARSQRTSALGEQKDGSVQHLHYHGILQEDVNSVNASNEDLGEPEVADCPMCGSPFERKLVRFEMRGHFFGYFPADVCSKGHDFLTEESSLAIEKTAIALGLFGSERSRSRPKAASEAG